VKRYGAVGKNSLTRTSKYGSVISAAYDAATTDGMNEKGLIANLLYLATADYSARDATKPGLSLIPARTCFGSTVEIICMTGP
jgi:penicillin V acylase-like amidase (Ntn superfamily)